MKIILYTVAFYALLLTGCKSSTDGQNLIDREQSFNNNWKFLRDSVSDAEQPGYDDSNWRSIDLPHDFAIEDVTDTTIESRIGPFQKDGNVGNNGGYIKGGTGWYRKHFTIDPNNKDKRITILFDGVMMHSDVWINGRHLGFHPYGYSPFSYDLTPYLNPAGESNVITVRAENEIENTSRWYSGAGIYRNVKLIMTDPIHVDLWGVNITTPEVNNQEATLNLEINIVNDGESNENIQAEILLIDSEGKIAARKEATENIIGKGVNKVEQVLNIKNPKLWSPETPDLYEVQVNLHSNKKLLDSYRFNTGIRSLELNTQQGLLINGKTVLLKGGSVHHDNGILGAAAFPSAEERKIEILKENGFNAIRTSHNPVSKAFLEACDKLGMLVIEEAFDMWTEPKRPEDYHIYFEKHWQEDLESMLKRDRNHACIIIWSIGNEIPERGDSIGLEYTKKMVDKIREFDTTRLTTAGVNPWLYFNPKHDWDYSAPIFEHLDVAGYNYNWQEWKNDHEKYPNRMVMTTESYPVEMQTVWTMVEKYPWIIGDFVWTSMDYLGEAGVGTSGMDNETNYMVKFGNFISSRTWPWFNAWCGDIDLIGNKKPQSFYRDVVWDLSQMEIMVHAPIPDDRKEMISKWGWPDELISWTWPGNEGKELEITVYSKCTAVRLELNGKVIDEKPVTIEPIEKIKPLSGSFTGVTPPTQLAAKFKVPYEAGELKAIGLVNGEEVVTKILNTAGQPYALVLKPEHDKVQADRNELVYINVSVADENGNFIPNPDIPFEVEVSGAGEIVAAGNASPNQMESFQDYQSKLFHGRAMIVVRPYEKQGEITVTAKSKMVTPATVSIQVMQ